MKNFLVVDGHSLIYRAFYAYPSTLTYQNKPINAVYGFYLMLLQAINRVEASYVAICFDKKEPTMRHLLYDGYKAHRSPMPDDLIEQVGLLQDSLQKAGFTLYAQSGYEADDLMGTLAHKAPALDWHTYVFTTDQDVYQLINDTTTVLVNKKKEWQRLTRDSIKEGLGITPEQIIDYKSLKGDASDNIPGVAGIGDKTAIQLLHTYHTLEAIFENMHALPVAIQKKLSANQSNAFLSKELATICLDAPLSKDIGDFLSCDWPKITQELQRFHFESLVKKYAYLDTPSSSQTQNNDNHINKQDGVIIDTPEQLRACLSELQATETPIACLAVFDKDDPMQASLVKLELSTASKTYQWVFASVLSCQPLSLFEEEMTCPDMIEQLGPFFSNPQYQKITYQSKDLWLYLARWGIPLKGVIFDIFLAKYLLNEDMHLSEDTSCISAWMLNSYPDYKQRLVEAKLDTLFDKVEMPLQDILSQMEWEGIGIDDAHFKTLDRELHVRLERLQQTAHHQAGQSFNLNSPLQLSKILFDTLALPTYKKNKSGFSTDASVLEKLVPHHPIATTLLEYRGVEKLLSTYVIPLPNMVHPTTQRIHTRFNQGGALTGRLSSYHPNLQNIPIRTPEGSAIRQGFVPKQGCQFVAVDYSQIELRILAQLSHDHKMKEVFHHNEDIHLSTASWIFGTPLESVSKEQRYRAKAINFGILYGMSAFGLAQNIGITTKEAKIIIDLYFNQFPTIQTFINQTIDSAKKRGYVRTAFGRIRYIPEITSTHMHTRHFGERTAVNTRIQGTAADIIKMAMIKVHRTLIQSFKASRILLQIHDELLLEVHDEEVVGVCEMLPHEMTSVVAWDTPLQVDIQIGNSWKEVS